MTDTTPALTDEQIDAIASELFYKDEPLDSVAESFRPQWLASIARPLARAVLAAAQPVAPQWISVDVEMPASGRTVLACYKNRAGNWRRIRAQWVAAKSCESSPESDIGEYDEETDTYYDPEGWYEQLDNWDEYSSIAVVEGDVSHWMPLPPPPEPKP
jgi:hypothetical protein